MSDALPHLFRMPTAEFFSEYLGRAPLYAPALSPEQPAIHASWDDINRVLNAGMPYPQAHLMQSGAAVSPDQYTRSAHGNRFIDPTLCEAFMVRGATLTIQAAPHLNDEVDALVENLARDLASAVRVYVVATLADCSGFRTHWDPADCLNVQIDGVKHWKVYRPLRPWPLTKTISFPSRSDVIDLQPPKGEPTVEFTTRPGDVLYLPRGWWHMVTPQVTPSLHLSIQLDLPTVSDALDWYVEHLKTVDAMRQPIPQWLDVAGLDAFLRGLSGIGHIMSERVVGEFIAQRALDEPPGAFNLPKAPDRILPPQKDMVIRTRIGDRLFSFFDDDRVTLQCEGRIFRFSRALAPVVERLQGRWISFDLLARDVEPHLVHGFLWALWNAGIVVIANAHDVASHPEPSRVPENDHSSRSCTAASATTRA
jgi:hypothetical protein